MEMFVSIIVSKVSSGELDGDERDLRHPAPSLLCWVECASGLSSLPLIAELASSREIVKSGHQ